MPRNPKDFSEPYDPGYSLVAKKISKVTGLLAENIEDIEKIEGRRRNRTGPEQAFFQITLGRVIANLYSAYKRDTDLYVAVRRGKWKKLPPRRYLTLPHSPIALLRALDGLKHEKLGYIEEHLGFQDEDTGHSRLTRIKAKQKLIDLIDEMLGDDGAEIYYQLPELVQLKDEDKTLIDYDDTDDTNRMRDNLQRINDFSSQHEFRINLTKKQQQGMREAIRRKNELEGEEDPLVVNYARNKLYRVFNNSRFDHGGRFYGGWWQSIPREYRSFIGIDGHGTWEFDYSGMSLNILYAMENTAPPEGDPYELDGYDSAIYRETIKKAFNAVLNATGKIDERKFDLPPDKKLEDIIDDLEDRHQPISKHFRSGVGLELMRKDSDIAELVMLKMIEQDIPALPIHDSFIIPNTLLKGEEVHYDHERALKTAMIEAYEEIIGEKPVIKMEKLWLGDLLWDKSNPSTRQLPELIATIKVSDDH